MHLGDKMSYLEAVLVHPVRRQNFGDAVAQKCNPYLIRCPMSFIFVCWQKEEKEVDIFEVMLSRESFGSEINRDECFRFQSFKRISSECYYVSSLTTNREGLP